MIDGGRLKTARLARGMTQQELGVCAGYTPNCAQSMMSQVETGTKQVSVWALQRMAIQLEVAVGDLLREGA